MILDSSQKGSKEFIISVAKEYNELLSDSANKQYSSHKVSLEGVDFSDADLTEIDRSIIGVFDFSGAILHRAKLDRILLDNIIFLLRGKKIIYSCLNLSNLYLGSKILERSYLGVRCNVLMNFSGVDLIGANLSGSNISEAVFDGCDIKETNFIDCTNIKPVQFIKTHNYHLAKFFASQDKDFDFKTKITNLQQSNSEQVSQPKKTIAHSFLATIFDPADDIRFDDPHYIAMKKNIQSQKQS